MTSSPGSGKQESVFLFISFAIFLGFDATLLFGLCLWDRRRKKLEKNYRLHLDVVEKCRHGDRLAQHQLYNLYSKAMYNISYRITNNQQDAEDVLQEAFVSAFKSINSFQGRSSFGAWLKKIVVNRAINQVRKRKMELVSLENKEEIPVEVVDDRQLVLDIDKIKNAISMLPDGYRVIFSLYLLEGYDHAEIAEILNISESTSKSQYSRSKSKLKQIIKKEMLYEN